MAWQGDKYRAAVVRILRGGNASVLAYFPQAQEAVVMDAQAAALLTQLRTFRDLDGHLAHIAREMSHVDPAAASAMLRAFVESGLLVKAEALLGGTDREVDPTAR